MNTDEYSPQALELKARVRKAWPGPLPHTLQGASPMTRTSVQCHARLLDRARMQSGPPGSSPEQRVDQALLSLCREDSQLRTLFFYFLIQRHGSRRLRLHSLPTEHPLQHHVERLSGEVYIRLKKGDRVLDGYLATPEPRGLFQKYANKSIRNGFSELMRTEKYGDAFWKHADPMAQLEVKSHHKEAREELFSACASAHDQAVRNGRKYQAEHLIALLKERIEATPDPIRREALSAWLTDFISSTEDMTQKQIADAHQIPESQLKNWIFRLKAELREQHSDTLARIFADTHADEKENPS